MPARGVGSASTPAPRSSSRAATDRLLADLRDAGWRPRAWRRFLDAAGRRSVDQAARHPWALAELTAGHGLLALAARHGGRRWVATSWLTCALHLGLLEDRRHLGSVNTVTLLRGNLPALARRRTPGLATLALCSDFVDGRSARATGTTTVFGRYADAFADAAFWTWFAATDRRAVRVAVALTWVGPPVVVTLLSGARGGMVDAPRPRLARPAAALQVLLTLRSWSQPRRGRG